MEEIITLKDLQKLLNSCEQLATHPTPSERTFAIRRIKEYRKILREANKKGIAIIIHASAII